jgi:hypothetical protein
MDATSIQYLTREQIDADKWDACIRESSNSLIYAHSFYLDGMARHWDALVMTDYTYVMPLPWNSKYGIRYIYQPFLTAQLGIFGKRTDAGITNAFIDSIPASFRLIELPMNSENDLSRVKARRVNRSNYTLDLHPSYENLYDHYREQTQRNIKKARQLGCREEKDIPIEEVIRLALQQMKNYSRESSENVDRFRKLYRVLREKEMTKTYGVFSASNELLASAVFFIDRKRAYYILVGNHPESRNSGASHFLIDAFIRDHAGRDMLLDFEGSDLKNLAYFYSSFGATHSPYPALKINRLPFFLRWMKE